jgi:hypothetical protein
MLVCCAQHAVGQVRLRNLSLFRPDTNILYVSYENALAVRGKQSGESLFLEIPQDAGHIHQLADTLFLLTPRQPGDLTVRVYGIRNGKKRLLQTSPFTVRFIEDGKPRVGSSEDTVMTVREILANPTLNIYMPGSFLRHHLRVISASVSLSKTRGDGLFSNEIQGNTLCGDQLGAIARLKPGDKIYFSDIRVGCPSSRVMNMGGLTIRII